MKATKLMKTSPSVISFAAIGGKKENEGPLGDYFDKITIPIYPQIALKRAKVSFKSRQCFTLWIKPPYPPRI